MLAGSGLPAGAPFGAALGAVNEGARCLVDGSMIGANFVLRGSLGPCADPDGNVGPGAGPSPRGVTGPAPLPDNPPTAMLPSLGSGD